MHLVDKVLVLVVDTNMLHEQGEHTPSLLVMTSMVNSLSKKFGHHRLNLKITTGRQFKEALKRLPREHQFEVLTEYGGDTDFSALEPQGMSELTLAAAPEPAITMENRPMMLQEYFEDRRLRRWIIRCAVYVCMPFVLVLTGATAALAWQGGQANGALISSLTTTAIEVLKIIISIKPMT